MHFVRSFLIISLCSFASLAHAAPGYKGELSFTDGERFQHQLKMEQLTKSAERCLRADLERHKHFINQYGVSAFYGDQSTFAKKTYIDRNGFQTKVDTTYKEKRKRLEELDLPKSLIKQLIPEEPCNLRDCPYMMQPTSCVGLARKCLGKGFRDSGQGAVWERLDAYVMGNDETGDSLLNGLQMLGWKILYWSPDPRYHEQWDQEEKEKFPGNPRGQWGHHAYNYLTVTRKQRYYLNSVDDYTSMVGFGTGTPRVIREAPLFVGIAHMGYHVFPGVRGQVIEGHSQRQITDPLTVEISTFAPLAPAGGPRGGAYRTGLVAIPPAPVSLDLPQLPDFPNR